MVSLLYKLTGVGFVASILLFITAGLGLAPWAWTALTYTFSGTMVIAGVMIITKVFGKGEVPK